MNYYRLTICPDCKGSKAEIIETETVAPEVLRININENCKCEVEDE